MGVQLNIKDPETVRLARELAGARGETVTATIRAALERVRAEREADLATQMREVNELVDEIRSRMSEEARRMTYEDVMEGLYDEYGAPI